MGLGTSIRSMPAPDKDRAMTLAEAQAHCTAVTKRSGSNFYYSFLFLSRARREAMYTVYAFCREVDSVVDEAAPGSDPQGQLRQWRAELAAAYHGTPTYPVTISLGDHARRLEIPEEYFEDLIRGVEMDLTVTRYRTFEDLCRYCYRVASVVGLICLKIFVPLTRPTTPLTWVSRSNSPTSCETWPSTRTEDEFICPRKTWPVSDYRRVSFCGGPIRPRSLS